MLTDYFSRALVAGVGLAAVTGPLGCFVVWRRMAYFGDTMAHSALLGVALSILLSINMNLGVFAVAALVAGALLLLQRQNNLSTDALLGILSHSSLAVGLVIVGFLTQVRIDLMGFLFGDILAVSLQDIAIIYGGGVAILLILWLNWRPLLAATVSPDLAEAEGLNPEVSRIILMLLMASVIAIAMKLVGVLLITSLLIIPAATARRLSATPEMMAIIAALLGAVAVAGGLFGSRNWDTASGPSIVVMALVIFLLSLALPTTRWFGRREQNGA
ncbi:metal ABC transporter permease [Devosia faecipullorum]|uniref:metal ABC transporter permease n=1 Tax=Devosia faecipullorum TaxID=2755039 RepID=UPI00187BB4DF|nr:metal ABC transporter permease [Devosia faecipullorum]MBE7733911.1 metal ABC transporter permease [Devosia faecipullorum]